MVCGTIPESFPVLDAEPPVARWPGKDKPRFVSLSEKQYQASARLARNRRFFLSGVLAANRSHSPRLGNAARSHQPNLVSRGDNVFRLEKRRAGRLRPSHRMTGRFTRPDGVRTGSMASNRVWP